MNKNKVALNMFGIAYNKAKVTISIPFIAGIILSNLKTITALANLKFKKFDINPKVIVKKSILFQWKLDPRYEFSPIINPLPIEFNNISRK